MPPWTYDKVNREVRFVVDFFFNAPESVSKVSWKPGVKRGTRVVPGKLLATLEWADGTTEPLNAPSGCNGVIEHRNLAIEYEELEFTPAEWAVILV